MITRLDHSMIPYQTECVFEKANLWIEGWEDRTTIILLGPGLGTNPLWSGPTPPGWHRSLLDDAVRNTWLAATIDLTDFHAFHLEQRL